jgi:hypothetical protein
MSKRGQQRAVSSVTRLFMPSPWPNALRCCQKIHLKVVLVILQVLVDGFLCRGSAFAAPNEGDALLEDQTQFFSRRLSSGQTP